LTAAAGILTAACERRSGVGEGGRWEEGEVVVLVGVSKLVDGEVVVCPAVSTRLCLSATVAPDKPPGTACQAF